MYKIMIFIERPIGRFFVAKGGGFEERNKNMTDYIQKEYDEIHNISDEQQKCAELFYFLCNAPLGAEMKRLVRWDYQRLYNRLYK